MAVDLAQQAAGGVKDVEDLVGGVGNIDVAAGAVDSNAARFDKRSRADRRDRGARGVVLGDLGGFDDVDAVGDGIDGDRGATRVDRGLEAVGGRRGHRVGRWSELDNPPEVRSRVEVAGGIDGNARRVAEVQVFGDPGQIVAL